MNNCCLLFAFLLFLGLSCSKEDFSNAPFPMEQAQAPLAVPTASALYNPIVGKWELGLFKSVCINTTDTLIYPNENGNFIEFRKNDTAYYTYPSANATGRSPFKVVDSTRFILGDTMQIIYNDGVRLTTFCKLSKGAVYQWMTYKKVSSN
ncbi:lipocalin family protein [Paraflavisolibacter sp. H34]|uniref:lipocalin family protein n=1 Tax=Huijunlia imazamoxiresistens TaxID=3127457 RepID=UPI00301A9F98